MEHITYEDFEKVDIRAGTIIAVDDFFKARKAAYQITIDFGNLGIKKSSAQITEIYAKEDLLDRQVIAIVNFAPKQIANFMSECLILGIYNMDNQVVLMKPEFTVPNGGRLL